MSEQKLGYQETKEALVGFMALSVMLAEQFKDGVQAQDIAPIIAKLQESPLKEKVIAAYNGIDKVPSEVKDIDLAEAFGLFSEIAPEFIALLKAIKK
jgi:hypothetical protein